MGIARPFSYRDDPAVPSFPDGGPLMVFDGHCGLCSRAVQFTLRHDRAGIFRFAPAQSRLGAALYRHYGLDASSYETFILVRDGRAYFASDAAIEQARALGFPWSMAVLAMAVPKPVRDWGYSVVARNRMRFFGRTDTCFLPSPEVRQRFLDR